MPKITLAAARKNAGFTQEQVAKELDVATSTIKNWENGKTFPKQPMIERLCELYQMPYDNIRFVG